MEIFLPQGSCKHFEGFDFFLLIVFLHLQNIVPLQLMWYSSGGTKSVLHQDSFENINCLYRGSKRLLIAEYPKFKKEVCIPLSINFLLFH